LRIISKIRRFMCESLDLHKWHYETPDYRICVICGQCEVKRSDIHASYWWILTFDEWHKEIKERKENLEKIKANEDENRLKAIEYLKEKGLWRGF